MMEILHLTPALNSHQQRFRGQTSPSITADISKRNLERKHTFTLHIERQTMERMGKILAMESFHVCFNPARDTLDFITSEFHTTSLQVAAKIRPRPS